MVDNSLSSVAGRHIKRSLVYFIAFSFTYQWQQVGVDIVSTPVSVAVTIKMLFLWSKCFLFCSKFICMGVGGILERNSICPLFFSLKNLLTYPHPNLDLESILALEHSHFKCEATEAQSG